jgi:hypothetical protein
VSHRSGGRRLTGVGTFRSEQEESGQSGVSQPATVSPLGGSEIRNPLGGPLPPSGGTALLRFLRPAALVKLAEKFIEIPFLRTLVALEGEKGSDFFKCRLHGD